MKTNKEKYDLIYKMVNELSENERCRLIGDLIEDVEISIDCELTVPSLIVNKGDKVSFN